MVGYLIIVLVIDLFALSILIKDLIEENDIRKKEPLCLFFTFRRTSNALLYFSNSI